MRELKVGERIVLECIEAENSNDKCLHCIFHEKCTTFDPVSQCFCDIRKDKTSVVFNEIELPVGDDDLTKAIGESMQQGFVDGVKAVKKWLEDNTLRGVMPQSKIDKMFDELTKKKDNGAVEAFINQT